MNRFITVLILIAAGVACLGWYRGWFDVTVDKNRIQADKRTAQEKAKDLEHQVKDAVTPATK